MYKIEIKNTFFYPSNPFLCFWILFVWNFISGNMNEYYEQIKYGFVLQIPRVKSGDLKPAPLGTKIILWIQEYIEHLTSHLCFLLYLFSSSFNSPANTLSALPLAFIQFQDI